MDKKSTGFFGDDPLLTTLRQKFNGCPPFSVLEARQGYWQQRKRKWLRLGIQSELGRGETASIGDPPMPLDRKKKKLSPGGSPLRAADYSKSRARGDGKGKAIPDTKAGKKDACADFEKQHKLSDFQKTKGKGKGLARCYGQDLMRGEHKVGQKNGDNETQVTGTSIFDPVLCELMYSWFCPPNGHILDPFAGGSVRGIIAGMVERDYTGIDLSENQIMANRQQADKIKPDNVPTWIVGESHQIMTTELQKNRFDFIFSCPPYHDLEVYSDDASDLSNMSYEDFIISYNKIIKEAVRHLKKDRFACFVVGEIRDKKGAYKNFVGDTITAFTNAGLSYYNEAILVTAVGSLPIRVGKQFSSGRKLGKTHQNILIFYKGDVSEIKGNYSSLYKTNK